LAFAVLLANETRIFIIFTIDLMAKARAEIINEMRSGEGR
jgi:hypothetical protein